MAEMRMGIVEEQHDPLNEFGWMIVHETDSSSVKCVALRICFVCVLT